VSYKITSRTPELNIKIGDPDQTITGDHVYTITYKTDQAINFFEDHDELYWNVTGNGWPVPIENASVSVEGPSGFDAASAKAACYTGAFGSTDHACSISPQGGAVTIRSTTPLAPSEGLSVVVSFPKGLIAQPTWADKTWRFVRDNGILVLPLLVFVAMYQIWNRKGRDPKGKGTVVPWYEPPRGLTPMEMSALIHQADRKEAITATIIDLARRGYIKVIYEKKQKIFGSDETYSFEKKKEADKMLLPHEEQLLNGLFPSSDRTELDDLKGKYYLSITKANMSVFSSLRKKGLFGRNPVAVRSSWVGAAVVLGFIAVFASFSLGAEAVWFVAIILSAMIIAVFGWLMPTKTKEGAILLEEVQGFKWFLSVTEKDRLAFSNAPKMKPEQFHEFLSYAIALGVEEQWAKQFEGLSVPEPDYMVGYPYSNPIFFIGTMHHLNASLVSTAYTPPASAGGGSSGFGGGGFSGGGFGGGGGGSW
jgi:uncharacterized membrane protein